MKYQYEVQLASLLHDIGKFYRKSCKKEGKVAGVEVSGGHPTIGKEFILYHKKLFENASLDVRALSEMVLRHHSNNRGDKSKPITQEAPKDLLSYCNIVNVADSMSSNSDRDSDKTGPSEYRPLRSVYGTLYNKSIYVKMGESIRTYDEAFDEKEGNEDRKLIAIRMIEDFSKKLLELEKADIKDPRELYTKIYNLMIHYTKCVNPATNDLSSDASLFDHSSTTCAIASCIHKNLYSKDRDSFEYTKYNDIPSGINIIKIELKFNDYLKNNRLGKNRMTLFIGKSLNIQKMMNKIIKGILDLTELTESNVLASSSSDCYILIPKCSLKDVVDYLIKSNLELFKEEASQVYLDFSVGNFEFSTKDKKVSFYSNIKNSHKTNGLEAIFMKDLIAYGKQPVWDLDMFKNTYNITKKTRRCLYCGKLTESDICSDCTKALNNSKGTPDENFSVLYFKDCEYVTNITKGFEENSTISRVATYMRLSGDFFGNEVSKLLDNNFEYANVILHNIDSCYVVCNIKDTYKVADKILSAYKKYTSKSVRLTCAIKEYKKSNKTIDFVRDCDRMMKNLTKGGHEVNVGMLGFMHRDTSINLLTYMNMLGDIEEIVSKGSSKVLMYKILVYLDELVLYAKTNDASHLMSIPLLTKEENKKYTENEIKLIQDILVEAKRLVSTGKLGKLKIYREAISRTLRSKED